MYSVRHSLVVAGTVTAAVVSLGLTGCRPATANASPSTGRTPALASATHATPTPPSHSRRYPPNPRRQKPPATSPSVDSREPRAIPPNSRSVAPAPRSSLLQRKLLALGYWLSKANGTFGATTQQAVYALQKAAGQNPSGVVTAKTWKALGDGIRPSARSKSGTVIEVDLKRDLVLFVTNGHVKYIHNTSTGGGYVFYENGRREVATTPKGHFTTYRVIDGPHRSPLGLLYRPRYFFEGVAIHGDSLVPSHPVSHGCVRVTDAAINWIWSAHLDPIGRQVWTY